ncbi:MAG: SpoIID/LytB domain-containing protein, partial [Synechococcaceae cyanobacterium SM2_3_60]|nr:SpoIID/LytB domain-containing protein [Synechococcaceae cyanobacterium SM2_3_60]
MKWRLLGAASVVVALSVPQSLSNPDSNPVLQVGIIQRFGTNPSDEIRLSAPSGSSLTLTAPDGETIATTSVTIGIYQSALTPPETIQRLILSSHRSFESAEASGQVWSELGIDTELAQPDEWQVWAHRDYDLAGLAQIYEWAEANERVNVRWHQETRRYAPLLQWQVGDQVFRDTQLLITTTADRTLVNDLPYAGTLRLQPNAYGNYTLVNTVPIETYLRGVVPHEIGYQAPQAAVEAQAILARTYALQNRHRFAIDNYELCADTQCQVYKGLDGTAWMADQAIATTAGQVLTYEGQLADAVYSSTTGGIT